VIRLAWPSIRPRWKLHKENFSMIKVSRILCGSRTLYHGTTRNLAEKILRDGLQPRVGPLVEEAYGDDENLEPLVFSGDKTDLGRGVYGAMLKAIEAEGHQTNDMALAIRNWGAVVVLKEGEDSMYRRPEEDDGKDFTDYPTQVEPGDYYNDREMDPDYIITGPALVRWLTRNGVDVQDSYNRRIPPQKINRLVGLVKKIHPQAPIEEILKRVKGLGSQELDRSLRYYEQQVAI